MTDPSTESKAVLTAIEKFDWEDGYFSREEIWFCSRKVVAAALRAAADQMRYSDQLGLTGFGGYVQAQDQILAIAAELEAQ